MLSPTIPHTLRFYVVGTGRSGTGYISQFLTLSGILTGHEEVYGYQAQRPDLVGECSWLAVPYLKNCTKPIFHVVRHPESTLKSMLGGEMFGPGRKNKWFKTREQFVNMSGLDMIDAMRIYVQWNKMCERLTSRRYRLEELNENFIDDVATAVDMEYDIRYPEARVNQHRKLDGFTLSDLPNCLEKQELLEMGERYGYL